MSYTESTMLTLGTEAPPFQLQDTISGNTLSLEDLKLTLALSGRFNIFLNFNKEKKNQSIHSLYVF